MPPGNWGRMEYRPVRLLGTLIARRQRAKQVTGNSWNEALALAPDWLKREPAVCRLGTSRPLEVFCGDLE